MCVDICHTSEALFHDNRVGNFSFSTSFGSFGGKIQRDRPGEGGSRSYDKNIKGNILSFEKFMIYEFCFANVLSPVHRKRLDVCGVERRGDKVKLRILIHYFIVLDVIFFEILSNSVIRIHLDLQFN